MDMTKKILHVPILDVDIIYGGMQAMETEYYIQQQLDSGSIVDACCWKDHEGVKFAYGRGLTLSVLAHEIVHLINIIYRQKGIKLDTENDEWQAYLTSWLFKNLYQGIYDET